MDEHLLFLFSFLDEVEKEIADDAEKQVWIEKCINIKTLSDFTVSCSYGDMVLIICVLKDYLKLIANKEGPTWDYYRDKFSKMAYRLSGQIGYNYEKAYERCQKKMNGKNSNDDIGEENTIHKGFMCGIKEDTESGEATLDFTMCHISGRDLEMIVMGCLQLGERLGMFDGRKEKPE